MIIFVSCGTSSLEDFRAEGQSIIRSLLNICTKIQTRDELVVAAPLLKKQFQRLAEVMIKAQEFKKLHPEDPDLSQPENSLSALLQGEMMRLFQVEGGKEIIEKCQEEALMSLLLHLNP